MEQLSAREECSITGWSSQGTPPEPDPPDMSMSIILLDPNYRELQMSIYVVGRNIILKDRNTRTRACRKGHSKWSLLIG